MATSTWNGTDCVLPDCINTHSTPCIDSTSALVWSVKTDQMTWENADSYCKALNQNGFVGWRLPKIEELRTLIQECPATITGSSCKVSEDICLVDMESCVCEEGFEWNGSECKPEIPECSATGNSFPCKLTSNGHKYMWSSKNPLNKDWNGAVVHCAEINEGGFEDWRLPTIDELRTLVTEECSKTQPGGSCAVSDPECLDKTCFSDATCACETNSEGIYNKLGDINSFWSSSESSEIFLEEETAWEMTFKQAKPSLGIKSSESGVRCVRDAE